MNYIELNNKLPASWDELSLKDYIKLSPILNNSDNVTEVPDNDIYTIKHIEDLDKSIQLISLLTDIVIDVIEELPMAQVSQLINKLSFIATVPNTVKPATAFKSFDQLSYDNFITFNRLQMEFTEGGILSSAVSNLPTMLSIFAVDKNHNEEYFLNQSMPEVIASFFTVNKITISFLQNLEASLLKQKGRMLTKTGMSYFQNLFQSKKNLIKGGTIG